MLKSIYRKLLKGLIDKSRIYVEKGRILMGCIDETGTLNEDECFIQCDEKNDEFQNNSLNQNGNRYIIIN